MASVEEDEEPDLPSRLEALILKEQDEHSSKKQTLSPEEKKKRDLWKKYAEMSCLEAKEVCTIIYREQQELKQRLIEHDSKEVSNWNKDGNPYAGLHHVAGVDISFDKDHPNHRACAMLAILAFPTLEVVHVSAAVVEMQEPYIPGFLAFRGSWISLGASGGGQSAAPRVDPPGHSCGWEWSFASQRYAVQPHWDM